jgi:hypothetical protein
MQRDGFVQVCGFYLFLYLAYPRMRGKLGVLAFEFGVLVSVCVCEGKRFLYSPSTPFVLQFDLIIRMGFISIVLTRSSRDLNFLKCLCLASG